MRAFWELVDDWIFLRLGFFFSVLLPTKWRKTGLDPSKFSHHEIGVEELTEMCERLGVPKR